MTRVSNQATEARLELLSGGALQIYEGQKMLVQLRFAEPAFGDVQDGTAVAHPLQRGIGKVDGTAEKWVALTAGGVPILAGDVGDDMLASQTYIAAGAEVSVKSFTYTQL